MRLKLIVFILLAVNLFALTSQENNLSSTYEKNVYQTDRYYRCGYNRDGCGWGCGYGYRGRGGYWCRGGYGYRRGYGYRGSYGWCRGY